MVSDNPQIINQQVLDALGPMQEIAPTIAAEMSIKRLFNAQWMLDHSEQPPDWPTMFGEPPSLSDFELQRFEQQLAISEDPLHALDLLAEDKLTVTDVEALKGMWPRIYEQMARTMLDALAADAERNAIPYNKRIQVGILLDTPTDPSMLPEQMIMAQKTAAAITQAPAEGAPGNFSAKAIEGVQREGTTMDQSALREA